MSSSPSIILCVEDDVDTQEMMRVMIGGWGYGFEVAGTCAAALQLIRGSKLGKLPPHNTNGTVLVEARIHLVRESVRLSTEDGSSREVYSAVIDELIHCEWR